jgi:hypothetical protein
VRHEAREAGTNRREREREREACHLNVRRSERGIWTSRNCLPRRGEQQNRVQAGALAPGSCSNSDIHIHAHGQEQRDSRPRIPVGKATLESRTSSVQECESLLPA